MALPETEPLDTYDQAKIQSMLRGMRKHSQHMELKAFEIYEIWTIKGATLSEQAGREIGLLYIKEILGLNPNRTNRQAIDDRLAGIKAYKPKIERFWNGVNKVAPQLIGGEDNLRYIIDADRIGDVGHHMICQIVYGPRGDQHTLLGRLVYGAPS